MEDDETSLKKTIQISFHLLNPHQQQALEILPVFPGSFDDLNAAEAVISSAIKTTKLIYSSPVWYKVNHNNREILTIFWSEVFVDVKLHVCLLFKTSVSAQFLWW